LFSAFKSILSEDHFSHGKVLMEWIFGQEGNALASMGQDD
jgi:hypothetical protein